MQIEEDRRASPALDVVSCGQVVLFKILRFGCLGTTGDHAEGVGSFVHIGEIEYDRKISRVVRGPGSASARIPVPNTFGRAIPIRSPNHDGMFISTELGSHNGLHKRKHGPRPHREIKFRLSEQDIDGLGSSVRRRSPQRFVLGQIPVNCQVDEIYLFGCQRIGYYKISVLGEEIELSYPIVFHYLTHSCSQS